MPRPQRKRQTTLSFSPLGASSKGRSAQPASIRDRAAAVVIEGLDSPAKRRKTTHGPLASPQQATSSIFSSGASRSASTTAKTRGQQRRMGQRLSLEPSGSEQEERQNPSPDLAIPSDSESSDDEGLPTPARRAPPRKRRAPSFVVDDNEDESEDDDAAPRRSLKRRRQDSPAVADDEEDSDGLPVSTARSHGRLESSQRDQQEEDDLEEDLEFLRKSSSPEPEAKTPRAKSAKQVALENLRKRRNNRQIMTSDTVTIPDEEEEEEPEEEEEVEYSFEQGDAGEDEDEDTFVVDEEDEDVDGEAVQMPIEFRLRIMKPKELFRFAVEWFVQNRINPGFERDGEAYQVAFNRLNDFVQGMAGSKYSSSAWTGIFLRALKARPILDEIHCPGEALMRDRCDACNRSGHPATWEIRFKGKPYDAHTLAEYSDEEDEDTVSATPLPADGHVFYVGKFCRQKASTGHALAHWKYHLNEWICDWLQEKGYLKEKKIVKRDKRSTKERGKEANLIVERMEQEGEIKSLYRDFKNETDRAQEAGDGHAGYSSD